MLSVRSFIQHKSGVSVWLFLFLICLFLTFECLSEVLYCMEQGIWSIMLGIEGRGVYGQGSTADTRCMTGFFGRTEIQDDTLVACSICLHYGGFTKSLSGLWANVLCVVMRGADNHHDNHCSVTFYYFSIKWQRCMKCIPLFSSTNLHQWDITICTWSETPR